MKTYISFLHYHEAKDLPK